jgi:conjugal transfer pilus assembly protein TraW
MKLPLLLIMLLMAFSLFCEAKEIKVGNVYPIHEKSMEELIAARIQSTDMQDTLKNYTKSFEAGITIPEAVTDREFIFTPWYVLPDEIRDQNNQLLFPKGFRFNPLTKVKAPGRLVFFNGSHINWVSEHAKKGDHLVMISGDVYSAMMTLKARVYLLDANTHKRLAITAVPSIYEQRGNDVYFTVNHYAL